MSALLAARLRDILAPRQTLTTHWLNTLVAVASHLSLMLALID